MDAVNAVRSAEDLNLALFTAAKTEEDEVEEKSAAEATAYENALYALTCEQINKSTIEPVVSYPPLSRLQRGCCTFSSPLGLLRAVATS